ncbi:MAG: choice-of-anchor L domain-containing protein, partial [Crocinitomicaceae bacterium]|nr:choice-of-anchor L domain-containing protein [Crocinitomicaceae bacterium]
MQKLIYLLLVMPSLIFAQLTTSGNMTPGQLVQNVLVGQGVSVSNVTYAGAPGAIGYFNGSNSSIGLDEGIILTTGTINSGPDGPYGPNNKPNAGLDNSAGGYGPLTNIVNKQTYNAAILEFDFVPQSDTVRFEYVFGSEEYPEWVGDQFNDVFAFFISGPGIAGNQNMAIIPGTTQPVTINNVNNGTNNNGPCMNCQFYVNNGTGNNAPFNTNPFFVQYDGFTTPLQAVSPVQCGETYRLIIAIADVGDAIFDSGIFLSANSLSSEQPVNV